jgi:hypothetical protein
MIVTITDFSERKEVYKCKYASIDKTGQESFLIIYGDENNYNHALNMVSMKKVVISDSIQV